MTDRAQGREELRPHVRGEQPPPGAVVVLRGGPDTAEKLAAHAGRTHSAFCLDGEPVWGVSLFAALDEVGRASLDGLLSGRLMSYRLVHMPTVGALVDAGFELLPTFRRPHFTVLLHSDTQM